LAGSSERRRCDWVAATGGAARARELLSGAPPIHPSTISQSPQCCLFTPEPVSGAAAHKLCSCSCLCSCFALALLLLCSRPPFVLGRWTLLVALPLQCPSVPRPRSEGACSSASFAASPHEPPVVRDIIPKLHNTSVWRAQVFLHARRAGKQATSKQASKQRPRLPFFRHSGAHTRRSL